MNTLLARMLDKCKALEVPTGMAWFVKGVYLWLAVNTLSLWSSYDLIWGTNSVLQRFGHLDGFLNNIAYHLVYTKQWASIIFHGHWILALLGMFSFRGVWMIRMVVWIFGIMIFYSAIEVFNSAIMVMNMMAFFLIFYQPSVHVNQNFINRLIYVMCVMQIIAVYVVSAYYKLRGEQWIEGTILYYVIQTPRFVSGFIRESWLINQSFLLAVLSYIALVYQLIFPILVWVKKGRRWLLLFGVVFHLFIALFMHLYDFGFAMIICYALFFRSTPISK
jgi:hypothetical protein